MGDAAFVDAVERDIYYYLKPRKDEFVPAREISRRVGGRRRFRYNPGWAEPVLQRMVERGILEMNGEEQYRLKPVQRPDTAGKIWASPEIANLLKKRGKATDHLLTGDDDDEYYEKL